MQSAIVHLSHKPVTFLLQAKYATPILAHPKVPFSYGSRFEIQDLVHKPGPHVAPLDAEADELSRQVSVLTHPNIQ